ncbi:hypothetical protein PIB30_051333 [Stylosanthes scabra]|uniref:Uncharacterized protein n=1 Tax=Stylosanthes scabra TaxID=79078 RepID=A0ABU6VIW9_9FABA|nr:hypothetical protein [Stylosanthes scabra]
MASVLNFPMHEQPGPDQEFLEWWYELPHMFLSPAPLLSDPRGREVDEVVATWGSQVPPRRTQVSDVPDRRGVERRSRVGTRASQRPDGDGDGAERVRRAQFQPPDERRPRARGRGHGGRGEAGQEDEVAEDGYVPLGDDQLGGGMLSPHQLYPDFASPGAMERQLGGEVCFSDLVAIWAQEGGESTSSHAAIGTPEFHVDLNEPASDYHDVYFSLGGTPASAYPHAGPSVPAPEVPQPPVQDPPEDPPVDEDDIPLACRLRRVPRRRGCGTGGHI